VLLTRWQVAQYRMQDLPHLARIDARGDCIDIELDGSRLEAEPRTGTHLDPLLLVGAEQELARDSTQPRCGAPISRIAIAAERDRSLRERLRDQIELDLRGHAAADDAMDARYVPGVELREGIRIGTRPANELCVCDPGLDGHSAP
jgi:hypothetical protein